MPAHRRREAYFSPMKPDDRDLGMHRPITRRDFVHDVGLAGLGLALPWPALSGQAAGDGAPYYPPTLTGLRGSHAGAFEVAHALAREGKHFTNPSASSESYDLVVVGGGISGLAAAYYYRKLHGPQSRILILDNHDDFVRIIRASRDKEEAKQRLMAKYPLSEAQTNAILEMRLANLTKLSVGDLQEEYDGLVQKIAELKAILADVKKVYAIIVKELEEVKEAFGKKRQTQITTEAAEMTLEDLITKEEVVISFSNTGYVKRIPVATYQAQGRGGKGITGAEVKDEDWI